MSGETDHRDGQSQAWFPGYTYTRTAIRNVMSSPCHSGLNVKPGPGERLFIQEMSA